MFSELKVAERFYNLCEYAHAKEWQQGLRKLCMQLL